VQKYAQHATAIPTSRYYWTAKHAKAIPTSLAITTGLPLYKVVIVPSSFESFYEQYSLQKI